MTVSILPGDCRDVLRTLPDRSVHCVVTSPPYFGLRDYGTASWKGGDPACEHTGSDRYYTEKTAASSSSDAFSEAGPSNAERLRKGLWREGGTCTKCGAIHSDGQIGLEQTPDDYVAEMVAVFRETRRVLRDDGVIFLNLGDSYNNSDKWGGGGNVGKNTVAEDGTVPSWQVRNKRAKMDGLKPKDLIGIPWRVAFALQADGWYLRQDIIWHKPNPMPESVRDRCTKAHEYVFLLSKSGRYYFDADAIAEDAVYGAKGSEFTTGKTAEHQLGRASVRPRKSVPRGGFNGKTNELEGREAFRAITDTRNKRSVWTIATQPFAEAHFATMAPELAKTCIMAGCPAGGTVLDPFGGAGTTGLVADQLGRNATLIELNPAYVEIARNRISDDAGMFAGAA